jgi:hypothetical protein
MSMIASRTIHIRLWGNPWDGRNLLLPQEMDRKLHSLARKTSLRSSNVTFWWCWYVMGFSIRIDQWYKIEGQTKPTMVVSPYLLNTPWLNITIFFFVFFFFFLGDITCWNSRGCHTSFYPFSIFREWGRGTLSLKGGGPILWRLRIPFFSSTDEEWRMEKTLCAKVVFFHLGSLLSPLEAQCAWFA